MTGTKLKVAVLYDIWGEEAAAVEGVEGKGVLKKKKKKKEEEKTGEQEQTRERRPGRNLRSAGEIRARAFLSGPGRDTALPDLAGEVRGRPGFQSDRGFRRRRHQRNERCCL